MKYLWPFIFLLISCGDEIDSFIGEESSSSNPCATMNTESCQMYAAVNHYRQSNSQSVLAFNERCTRLAQDHAKDMHDRDYFSHNSPNETFSQRVSRYGLSFYVGENIAMGSSDVTIILDLWKNSPGHNQNMLQGSYRSTGLGYYNGYWVQCFSGEEN